jgi:S-adenosylmethionine:tRNA ribosyltransferase-isomerase
MRRPDFHYDLPPERIAQQPLAERGASRLLVLDGASGAMRDAGFRDLPGLLHPGDLLVLNDTRVLRARLAGRKDSGGSCEILVERLLSPRRFLAQGRASKGFRAGSTVRRRTRIATRPSMRVSRAPSPRRRPDCISIGRCSISWRQAALNWPA